MQYPKLFTKQDTALLSAWG